jgi:hypothetical protein
MQAAVNLDNATWQPNITSSNTQNILYIHWRHHPGGLQRAEIRRIFESTLQPYLPYERMQIAMSRPKNLRKLLTKTALSDAVNIDTLIAPKYRQSLHRIAIFNYHTEPLNKRMVKRKKKPTPRRPS